MELSQFNITSNLKIVDALPILYIEDEKVLVIADLHLGIEAIMSEDGTYLEHNQTQELIETVSSYLKQLKPRELVLNGDVKHSFHEPPKIENRDVKRFLKEISPHVRKISITQGNHDLFLNWVIKDLPNVKLYKENYSIGKYYFTHGDKKLPKELPEGIKYIIIGHEHPIIEAKVNKLQRVRAPVFVVVPLKKGSITLIVLPAFSNYSSGTPINPAFSDNLLSPILRNDVNLSECQLYALDKNKEVFHFPSFKEWT
ncbi:MAG: metallophosphoesterase [Candidatus Heimdallarchaeota archaeon]|nr:metallophosphoesterase [Candidatus Heimdallarchaeota archaeon]